MKVDMQKAKQAFKEYVKDYNPENKKIKLKISHIERVATVARQLAESLNLSQEDIELAELIGLLHDIGRFEQVRLYNTFIDKDSINHGEFGVKILFEDGLIRKFIETDEFDEIIKKSILNHNRAYIEKGLDERTQLHAKIIRDADKTDILNLLTFEDKEAAWGESDLSNDVITKEIYQEFMQDRHINYQNMKTSADLLVAHFAYVYDIYFNETLRVIKENHYYDNIYKRFEFNDENTTKMYNEVYEEVKKYLEEKG